MSEAPHHQASFINAIAEEGSKSEAVKYLQDTWNELCEARVEIHRLRAEIDRLREALAMLLFTYDGLDNEEPAPMTKAVFEARAALKETGQ